MIRLNEKSGNSKRSVPFRYWEVKKTKKPKKTPISIKESKVSQVQESWVGEETTVFQYQPCRASTFLTTCINNLAIKIRLKSR